MKLYNIVKVYTSTVGTGTVTLGSAVPSFITFATAGVVNGSTVSYAIEDGNNREVGTGTYTSGAETLTRSVVTSTNSNNLITLSGNAVVFITGLAADLSSDTANVASTLIQRDGSGNFAAGAATLSSAVVPLIVGGTGTTSTLTLRSTSGVGTTGADIVFQTGNNGATEVMRLQNGGNVGIGTASPADLLNVRSDQNASTRIRITNASTGSSAYSILALQNSTDADAGILRMGSNNSSYSGANSIALYTVGAYPIGFVTNNLERMRILSTGEVGIGTSSPVAKTDIYYTSTAPSLSSQSGAALSLLGSSTLRIAFGSDPSSPFGGWIQSSNAAGTSFPLNLNPLGGNVGIGTASPDALLTVSGVGAFGDGSVSAPSVANTGDLNTGLWFPAADTIAASTGGSERLRIDSSGNVTIGSTGDNSTRRLGFTTASGGTSAIESVTVGATDQALVFKTTFSTESERMRIDGQGNVGIGTASPTCPLEVNGAARIQSKAFLAPGAGKGLELYYLSAADESYLLSYDRTGAAYKPLGYEGSLHRWQISGSEKMRLDSSGNVLIGATSPAGFLTGLQVSKGATESSAEAGSLLVTGPTTAHRLAMGYSNTYNAGWIQSVLNGTASTPLLLNPNGGNVGIGTSSPSFLLDLYKASFPEMRINDGVTTFQCYVSSGVVMGTVSNHSIVFRTNATERMRIDFSGNVKIGGTADRATTAGAAHLDIFNGTAPAGTLANGISIYSSSGEAYVMDAAGNATLFSPHDRETNEWIFDSTDTRTGKRLKINVERLLRFINDHFGLDCVHDLMEEA